MSAENAGLAAIVSISCGQEKDKPLASGTRTAPQTRMVKRIGGVPEWSNGTVLKALRRRTRPDTLRHDTTRFAGISWWALTGSNTPGHAGTRFSCGQEMDKRCRHRRQRRGEAAPG